jgi:hypothetical protein
MVAAHHLPKRFLLFLSTIFCPSFKRDAATHTARLQVGWYIIFMASESEGGGGEVVGRWWGGGGEVVGRWWSDASIASEILVPGSNPKNR